tara:strand:- start:63 stop:515 length:453 start_codon:yes stop_codon:yes gene_type:complete
MKLTILILTFFSYTSEIISVRDLFISAYKSELHCDNFGEKLYSINMDSSPLFKGYLGCYYFIKCKYLNNPVDKLSFFKEGKRLLESAISEDPSSVELRLLRYSIQKKIPRVLLYYDSLEEDIIFVNENIINITDKSTKDFILYSLNTIDL